MQYKIVKAGPSYNAHEDLEIMVNNLIEKGWKPIGGVTVAFPFETYNSCKCYQAMIKE